jgi:hypothetical protein
MRPLLLVLILAAGLGACSKCDVPTWGQRACTETPRR